MRGVCKINGRLVIPGEHLGFWNFASEIYPWASKPI